MLSKSLIENELVQEVLSSKSATTKENAALVRRIQSGDKKAESEFIVKNGRRILNIIDKYNFDAIIQPDLFQVGLMAMLETARTAKQTQLSWLLLRIDRNVLFHFIQFIRENYELVQMPLYCTESRERVLQYFECKDDLPEMSMEEIAKTFKLKERVVQNDLAADLDHESVGDDYAISNKYSPATLFEEKLLSEIIANRIELLTPREQTVLFLRLFNPNGPLTIEEAGNVLGCTRLRIMMVEAKAIRKLRHPSKSGILKEFMYDGIYNCPYPALGTNAAPAHKASEQKNQ